MTDESFACLAASFAAARRSHEDDAWEFEHPFADEWHAQRQAELWRELVWWRRRLSWTASLVDGGDMLKRLLVQNKYLSTATKFTKWPSRDRHQLWATLWLALRFRPGGRARPRLSSFWRACC